MRCRLRVHRWTRWTVKRFRIVGVDKPYSVDGQQRRCARCGLRQEIY